MQALNPEHPPSLAPQDFEQILHLTGTTLWGVESAGQLASTATLHLLPNLTYGGRPYGVIENVVTLPAHRGQGLARAVFDALFDQAQQARAYKLMLLTGKKRGAQGFYEALGFDSSEKTAMILRLE